MSRVGNKPIEIPKGVSVSEAGGAIHVEGPKGALEQIVPPHIEVALDGGSIRVSRDNNWKQTKSFHGMTRALLQNMVTGVTAGWKKEMRIEGVGYAADVEGSTMNLRLGYSHQVRYDIPDGVTVTVEKGNQITVEGVDRELVGHVAAVIRSFRKPDAYKGKGIRYKGEQIKLKPGKAAVT